MKIILLRHAESTDNNIKLLGGSSESVLTDVGKEQATKIGKELDSKYIFTKIFSSPRKRCLMTSDLVLKELKGSLKLEVKDILTERDFGVFTGKPMKDVDFDLIDSLERGNKYKVETIDQMKERIEGFIKYLKENLQQTDVVLVVTHSNTIRTFKMIKENLSFIEVIKQSDVKNSEYVEYEL